MNSRTKSIVAYVGVAAVLLFGVVWSLEVRSSQSKAIARANAHQVDAASKLSALQLQQRSLLQVKARIPAVQAQLAALQLALPGKAELPQVIDDIRQVSSAAGVDLTDLSQTDAAATTAAGAGAAAASGLQVVTLGITAVGTYPQLMNYVTKLNLLPRTVVVDGLTVGVGTDASNLTVKIAGRMFYVPTGS